MWRLGCDGAIIRNVTGTTAHIKAAMLLADLRGFGRLTDELLEERIIELSQCLLRMHGGIWVESGPAKAPPLPSRFR